MMHEARGEPIRDDRTWRGARGGREGALLAGWLRAAGSPECPAWLEPCLKSPTQRSAQKGNGIDWNAVFARAHAQGIAPILHASLQRWGGERAFSPRLAPFGAAYRATLRHNVILLDELARVAGRFSEEGIETICLKGAALVLTAYPHPALRPMGDLDLLVREADVPRALRVAQALGFTLLRPGLTGARLRTKHEIGLTRRLDDGTRVYLEIHWRFIPRESLVAGPWREPRQIWVDSRPSGDAAIPARVLAPEDAIVFGALHLERHVYSRAIWFVDLGMILQTERIDWDAVVKKAELWQARGALYLALRGLASLCGLEAPPRVMAAMHPGRIRAAWAESIVSWRDAFGKHAAREEHALSPARRYLLKLLLARDTLAALAQAGRMFFPSDAWLRARYGLQKDARGSGLRFRHLATAARAALGAGRR
jgi:hypothetical protein